MEQLNKIEIDKKNISDSSDSSEDVNDFDDFDFMEYNEHKLKAENKEKLLMTINKLFDEIEILQGLIDLHKHKLQLLKDSNDKLKNEIEALQKVIDYLKHINNDF